MEIRAAISQLNNAINALEYLTYHMNDERVRDALIKLQNLKADVIAKKTPTYLTN
jgi:hypothetical protein